MTQTIKCMESIQEVSKGIPELDLEVLINNVKEGEPPRDTVIVLG